MEYREALYNTKLCFKDPALVGGTVAMDNLGMPKPISGASASVFNIENASGERWAVKCFTRFVDHQAVRYQCISEALQAVRKPWRVGFEYLPNGVLSQGSWYPALKMEWIDAIGLMPFIEDNLWNSDKLAELAEKFAQMVEDLSVLGIAHGDLQHGNLLVTSSGELKLIDYDGMFVPSLAQIGACEKGHVNYQSPARTMQSWGPYLDNFSAWIIYISLIALTIDPGLWTLLHDQGDEALLFNHDDFLDRQNSRALLALAQSSSSDLQALGHAVSRLRMHDIRSIPTLDATSVPAPNRLVSTAGPTPLTAPMNSANAASGTIPDWVTQVQTGAQARASNTQGSASWVSGHLAPLPLVPFHPSRTSLRIIFGLWLAVMAAAGIITGTGTITSLVAGAAACIAVLTFVLITIRLYRGTPECLAKHERLDIVKERRSESSKAARQLSKLKRMLDDVDDREHKAVSKLNKQSEKAKAAEEKELSSLDKKLTAQIQSIERRKQRVQANETTETGNALRAYQGQHVANYLSRSSISSAQIPGIGPGVVRSLGANGIHSAADFTGIYYQTGPRGGQQIYIRRRDGLSVHPTGVGEKKARDLESWRQGIRRVAVATQPSSLPAAQVQAIRTKYTQQRKALADEEQAARQQAISDQGQIKQKWAATYAAISGELVTTRQSLAQERAQADRNVATAQKQLSTATWQRDLAERELAAYRDVSYRRYIVGIIRP